MRNLPGAFLSAIVVVALLISCSPSRKSNYQPDKKLLGSIDGIMLSSANQYKLLAKNLPADKFPKTYFPTTGKYEFSNSGWWCSGFYSGTLLYLYEQTRDTALYNEAMRNLQVLEKEKNNTTTHDLGFMMYCSFGNANRISPKPEYKDIILTSARSLSTRFNPTTGCIKSWDSRNPTDYLVIIDNMMNLDLLFAATRMSGDTSFKHIAVTHTNTTMKNHFRDDFSTYHVLNYDAQTGAVKQKRTAQGAADSSAWARGQAWGLYGFTETYRNTRDVRYLNYARQIATFLLTNPNLPKDGIPYWDFDAPDIPNALRDASAAAIMASALLELAQYVQKQEAVMYLKAAENILTSLSNKTYLAAPGTNGGFILQHGVGHKPAGTEVDVPLTYGDYYFIEALIRYKNLKK